jgi:hypothetical protein
MSEFSDAVRNINVQLEFIRKKYPSVFQEIMDEAEVDLFIFKIKKLPGRMYFTNMSVKYSNISLNGRTKPDLSRALGILADASQTYHLGKDGVSSKAIDILNLPRRPAGTVPFMAEQVHRITLPE